MRRVSRRTLLLIAVAAIVVGAGLLYWFEPQALVIDDRVDEKLPQSMTNDDVAMAPGKPQSEAKLEVLAEGRFRALNHSAEGTVRLIELADGARYLRFEDFEVENGPDLRVYLSRAPSTADDGFNDDYLDLGALKGNVGDQNYLIPEATRLDSFRSVVVWCRRFSVGFAVAPIELRAE